MFECFWPVLFFNIFVCKVGGTRSAKNCSHASITVIKALEWFI